MSYQSMDKVLIVHPEAGMRDALARRASGGIRACISEATNGAEALELDEVEAYDVVVAAVDLGDMTGMELSARLRSSRRRPVILMGDHPTPGQVIEALRGGVADFLSTPIDGGYFVRAVARALGREAARRRRGRRAARDRALIRRVLEDRRQLNQRIELICKDMVGAHRRLFHRVLAFQQISRRG